MASSSTVTGRPFRFSTASSRSTQRSSCRFRNFLKTFDHFSHPSRSPLYFSGLSTFLWLIGFSALPVSESSASRRGSRPISSRLTLLSSHSSASFFLSAFFNLSSIVSILVTRFFRIFCKSSSCFACASWLSAATSSPGRPGGEISSEEGFESGIFISAAAPGVPMAKCSVPDML